MLMIDLHVLMEEKKVAAALVWNRTGRHSRETTRNQHQNKKRRTDFYLVQSLEYIQGSSYLRSTSKDDLKKLEQG